MGCCFSCDFKHGQMLCIPSDSKYIWTSDDLQLSHMPLVQDMKLRVSLKAQCVAGRHCGASAGNLTLWTCSYLRAGYSMLVIYQVSSLIIFINLTLILCQKQNKWNAGCLCNMSPHPPTPPLRACVEAELVVSSPFNLCAMHMWFHWVCWGFTPVSWFFVDCAILYKWNWLNFNIFLVGNADRLVGLLLCNLVMVTFSISTAIGFF